MHSISEEISTLEQVVNQKEELDENIQRQFLEVRRRMKPMICQNLKFIYFDIPKCACTSLKHWIYQIEFNKEFKRYKQDNRWIHIHNCGELNTIQLQKILEKKQDYKIITVIRDPIKRLISAYSNRVIHHKELSESVPYRDEIKAAGLKFDPDINYLIDNLESYQNYAKSILFHTRPITHFIGQNLSLYTNIYPIEEVNRIKEDVLADSNPSLNTDSLPEIAKLQSGGPKLKLNVLKPESFDKLVAYYAKDYEILRNYYPLEKIKEEYISSIVDRGNELKEQGMLSESIENYQNVILLQPKQPVWFYVGLGDALTQNGKIDEALAVYQEAIEIAPDNCRTHPKLAKLMMRQGNTKGAVTVYQKAITHAIDQNYKQPEWFYRWIYIELGEALEKNGQADEAIAAYQKAIEITPDDSSRALAKLAKLMMRQGNTKGAVNAYQKAIAQKPKQPVWVYVGLGDALNQNGQIEEAISAYQKAIEITPENPQLYVKQSRLYFKQYEIDKVIEKAKAALQLNPDFVPALDQLAEIYESRKEFDRAVVPTSVQLNLSGEVILEKILNSTNKHILGKLVKLFLKKERFYEATRAMRLLEKLVYWPWGFYGEKSWHDVFEVALENLSNQLYSSPEVAAYRGMLLLRFHKFVEASEFLTEAVLAGNKDIFITYDLAMALFSTKRYDQMRNVLQSLIKTSPKDEFIFNRSIDLLCNDLVRTGRWKEITSLIEQNSDRFNQSATLQIYNGLYKIVHQGKHDEGIKYLIQASQLNQIILPTSRGYRTLRSMTFVANLKDYDYGYWLEENSHVEYLIENKPTIEDEFVVLVTCDLKYFKQYIKLYLEGLEITNKGVICHIHIINSEEDTLLEFRRLQQHFPRLRLNGSLETTRLKSKVYYASARFIHARKLLDIYNIDICITDIDIVVGDSFSIITPTLRNGHLSVSVNNNANSLPWQRYTANLIALPNKAITRQYLQYLAGYLIKLFSNQELLEQDIWWADQSALYCTIEFALCNINDFKLINLQPYTSKLIYTKGIDTQTKQWLSGTKQERMRLHINHLCKANLKAVEID